MDEETKQKLLEELRKEYRVELKPLKEKPFSVKDIIDENLEKICERIDVPNDWSETVSIESALRKIIAIKFKARTLKDVEPKDREKCKEELKRFIKEYILEEE